MKIIHVRTGGLGDSLLTLPVAGYIKKLYSSAQLHILGNETMLSVAALSGMFYGLHSVDKGGFYTLYSDSTPSEFLKSFFSGFDIVYFFTAAREKKIIEKVLASGARNCRVLDPRPPENFRQHIVEHLKTILGVSDELSSPLSMPETFFPRKAGKERKGLVIHPGSGGKSKIWPLDNFIRVAEEAPVRTSFLIGPAEIECSIMKALPAHKYNIVRTDSLGEVCGILSGAELYLGNDSGVSHFASFCGTPSVVLFGPSDPVIWRPLGSNVTVISSVDGTMAGISIEEVLNAVRSRLIA